MIKNQRIQISTTVDPKLHAKAKEANVKWATALHTGLIRELNLFQGEAVKERERRIIELEEGFNKIKDEQRRLRNLFNELYSKVLRYESKEFETFRDSKEYKQFKDRRGQ